MKITQLIIIVCSLAIFTISCGAGKPDAESDLVGGTWELTSLNGTDPLEDHRPTLEFKVEEVSGNTGCNHYGGSYQIQGDTIRFEDLNNTEMACQDPAGIMEQEQVYMELLRTANRIELTDGELIIFIDLRPILRFSKE